jgi:hypothetical protein
MLRGLWAAVPTPWDGEGRKLDERALHDNCQARPTYSPVQDPMQNKLKEAFDQFWSAEIKAECPGEARASKEALC